MYRLYWAAGTGAIAPEVMLEAAGTAFERIVVDLAAGEHRRADYLAVNPVGEVPALVLPDGTVVTESAAIVLLLGERRNRPRARGRRPCRGSCAGCFLWRPPFTPHSPA